MRNRHITFKVHVHNIKLIISPWPDSGGGGGGFLGVTGPPPPSHSTAIYKCRSIQISFRLGGLRRVKMANSFLGGGGCQRKSKLWGKLRLFLIIDYQGQSKTDIYAVFLFRDPPPPSPCSFWIRPCITYSSIT